MDYFQGQSITRSVHSEYTRGGRPRPRPIPLPDAILVLRIHFLNRLLLIIPKCLASYQKSQHLATTYSIPFRSSLERKCSKHEVGKESSKLKSVFSTWLGRLQPTEISPKVSAKELEKRSVFADLKVRKEVMAIVGSLKNFENLKYL